MMSGGWSYGGRRLREKDGDDDEIYSSNVLRWRERENKRPCGDDDKIVVLTGLLS